MNKILKLISLVIISFIVLVFIQGYGYANKLEHTRNSALEVWSKDNEALKSVADEIEITCLKGKRIDKNPKSQKFVSVYDCVKEKGGNDLVILLRSVDENVHVPAPLSWL